ncbi:hypothetical protein [Tenacibaculum soleae]|uniref:hypothetical protein n=1 Tax=Tenacibaculum soleae TaxID=447689 RepID=UPI0026E412D8|nr:hypothetical protein [Tenacibaculum soleae]MDO6813976.1 hypothetical protein [Tenacibaculum soleae]
MGGEIKTSQLVTITNDNLTYEQYTGYIENSEVTILKTNDSEYVFKVPSNVELGEQILNITNLQNFKIKYLITETIINSTPDETLSTYFSSINDYLTTTQGTANYNYTNAFMTNLNDVYANSSEEDKISMAKYYKANKALFDEILTTDFANRTSSSLTDLGLLTKYGFATLACGLTTAAAILDPEPTTKLVCTGIAIIAWNKAANYKTQFAERNLKVLGVIIDGVVGNNNISGRSENQAIEFTTNQEISLSLETNNRAIINSDENDNNGNISEYFSKHNKFNTIIGKLNTVIQFLNDNIFFSNISLLSQYIVNNTNQISNITADQDSFNNLNVSLSNSNLILNNISFENGNIKLTVSIIDESIVTEFVEAELNFSFNDEFNNISGSLPIKVNKTPNPFIGNWQAISFNGQPFSAPYSQSNYNSQCDVYQAFYYINNGTATITEQNINILINRYLNFYIIPSADNDGNLICSSITLTSDSPESNYLNYEDSYIYDGNNVIENIDGIHNNTNGDTFNISPNRITLINENEFTISIPGHFGSDVVVILFSRQ